MIYFRGQSDDPAMGGHTSRFLEMSCRNEDKSLMIAF
jgi:hypothetical protein